MRKTKEELDLIMKQENVSRLWSWSRINTYLTSPYEYLLKYIKHTPEDRKDSIYVVTGGMAHDILEKLYTNQIKYEDMYELFDDVWLTAYDISNLKFDRNDEEKNIKIADKYYENLKHFFMNHTPLEFKPVIEQFTKVKIGEEVFFGYLDCIFKDNEGNYNIIDFKTSSIYKGEKLLKEAGQLILYAIALYQMGVPLDKIKIAWNFLKYVKIEYTQANGVVKTREVERCKIGESLQSNAKVWLKKFGYDVDYYLKLLLDMNDIKYLPEDVQEKYKITDCYVYVDLKPDLAQHWYDLIMDTVNEIKLREKEYEETGNDKAFWDTEENLKKQEYYFATLCGYSPALHKPYAEYIDKNKSSKDDFDLLGLNSVDKDNTKSVNNEEFNLDWLNDI